MIPIKQTLLSFDKTLLYKLSIFLVLYVIIIFFGIIPSIQKGSKLKETRSTTRDARTRALNQAKTVGELSQQCMRLEAVVQEISNRVANEKEVKNMVAAISEMASSSKVKINEIAPIDLVLDVDDNFKKFSSIQSFELTFESDYHSLGKFLEKIENHDKIIRIAELKLVPDSKLNKIHKGSLTISVFSRKNDLLNVYSNTLKI